MTPEKITTLRKDKVDAIVEGLDDLTPADLAELLRQEQADAKPRPTLLASIEKAIASHVPVPDAGTDAAASTETPDSEPTAGDQTDAEKDAAAAEAKAATAARRKAAMMNLPYMKPDYSGPISSQVVDARQRFAAEFDESPWEEKIQTK